MSSFPKGQLPPTDNQWATAFTGGGRGLHAETAQSAPTVILKLIAFSTVSLQFPVWCVPISLRAVPGIVVAYVMVVIWPSHSYILPPDRGFVIYKSAQKTWLGILSIALEEKLSVLDLMTEPLLFCPV